MLQGDSAEHADDTLEGEHPDSSIVRALIADLDKDGEEVRVRAREALVALGKGATTPLTEALGDRKKQIRLEAARVLGRIGDEAAAPALVKALEDRVFEVRWLAAESLIALRHGALVPLLRALVGRPNSVWLREGAHHVLSHAVSQDFHVDHHKLSHPTWSDPGLKAVLQPVVLALEDAGASVVVLLAAGTALETLRRQERQPHSD